MSRKRKRSRSMRSKWIEGDKGRATIGRGTNNPMNFNKRNARKPRAKGQPGGRS